MMFDRRAEARYGVFACAVAATMTAFACEPPEPGDGSSLPLEASTPRYIAPDAGALAADGASSGVSKEGSSPTPADSGSAASEDAAPSVIADAPLATPDGASDTGVDVPVDAGMATSLDAGEEAGTDASTEAAPDADAGSTPADASAAGICQPLTCAGLAASCGTLPDGCGGALECGSCPSPGTCGGGGTAYQCGCTPNCAAYGKQCGDDGCGGSCGACAAGQVCGGAGTCALPSTLETIDVDDFCDLSIEPGSITMPLGSSFTLSWKNISVWYDVNVEIDNDYAHSFTLTKGGDFGADLFAYVCDADSSKNVCENTEGVVVPNCAGWAEVTTACSHQTITFYCQ